MDAQQQLSYFDFHNIFLNVNFWVKKKKTLYLIDELEQRSISDRFCPIAGTSKIDKWIIYNSYFVFESQKLFELKAKRFSLILSGTHPYIEILPKKVKK